MEDGRPLRSEEGRIKADGGRQRWGNRKSLSFAVSHQSPVGLFSYGLALKLNFWPPMAASYIRPPMVCTNTAMPL